MGIGLCKVCPANTILSPTQVENTVHPVLFMIGVPKTRQRVDQTADVVLRDGLLVYENNTCVMLLGESDVPEKRWDSLLIVSDQRQTILRQYLEDDGVIGVQQPAVFP